MIIIGNITQLNSYPLKAKSSKIYLLDISNYTWVDTFEIEQKQKPNITAEPPVSTNSPAPSITDSSQLTMKIAITAVCGIFGTASLIGCGILLYRWHKRRQRRILRVFGR